MQIFLNTDKSVWARLAVVNNTKLYTFACSWQVFSVFNRLKYWLNIPNVNSGLCSDGAKDSENYVQFNKWLNEKHQPDAVNKYIFHLCSVSTCFGQHIAHHQENNKMYKSAYGVRP